MMYLLDEDVASLCSMLDSDPDIALICSDGDKRWKAQREIPTRVVTCLYREHEEF